jgi:hypothetical protein
MMFPKMYNNVGLSLDTKKLDRITEVPTLSPILDILSVFQLVVVEYHNKTYSMDTVDLRTSIENLKVLELSLST